MQLSTAINVLTKRAENFYGKSLDWLISTMDDDFMAVGYYNETVKVIEAYKVYKGATP
tara:strand:- start:98 stop:271 length:174 start_codon:yes stop_codon:yes gene_type:complete